MRRASDRELVRLGEMLGLTPESLRITSAGWRDRSLALEVEGPGVPKTCVLFGARQDGAPAFATTPHLRITYQGRSIPDALHRELTALATRIDGVRVEDLEAALAPKLEIPKAARDPAGGLRAPTRTDLGALPALLGLNAPDESKKALRVCAAEWWGEELVLEIDGPGLRPATITIAPRDESKPAFRSTARLALSHETELNEALYRALDELTLRWAALTLDALKQAYPPPGRVHDPHASPDACGGPSSRGGEDREAVSRGWAGAHQWRRFFASQEMDRNILRSVRLSHEAIYVEHGDLECFYSTPGFRKRVPSFINYPWPDAQAPDAQAPDAQAPGEHAGDAKDLALVRDGAPMTYTSDMNESDVVLGGADKLDALIEAVSRKHKGKPIHFNCTCPPIVIADPVAPILTKIRKKHDAPVVHTTQDPGSSLHLFAAMLRGDGAEVERDPEGVNLVGFVADRGRDELVALLEAIGLRVHARLIPSAPRAEVARYGRASAQVFFPNAPFRAMYHAAFADLPLRSVHAPPPFGMQGTRRWLEVIAQDFGKQAEVDRAVRALEAPLAPRWEALRDEARGHRLAFVVDRADLMRLTTPERMAGKPVVPMLAEMGFGLELFMHAEAHGEGLAELARERLGVDHVVRPVADRDGLSRALRESSASAVYSEIFFDRRLTRAGKAQFHAGMFEQGMGGALRTLERLLAVCRLPFYRKLGRYLERSVAR